MKQRTFLIGAIIIAVAAIGYYSFQGTDKDYIDELVRERKAKDEFVKIRQ
ncbi:MAG: hypothetical protein QM734_00205 [Cyclobacteriaceae bacterium]